MESVLVIDDDPAIRALVAKIVERAGLSADTARDGAEGIRKLGENTYTVVVLDLMMPNVDGFAVVEYVKQHVQPRPAIIVASAGEPAALRTLDGSLVHSILRKPFEIDVLGDLIAAASVFVAREREKTREAQVIEFRKTSH
jgi:two-component system response regulator VanR